MRCSVPIFGAIRNVPCIYFSDTCVDQGPTAISVGTGQESFMRFYDTEDSVEGKWADIEYLSVNAKNECRDIVAQNDGYVFR